MAGNQNSGRIADAVKHRFARILQEADADKKFKRILQRTKDDTTFLKAYDMANDRAYGKAVQQVDTNDITEKRPDKSGLEAALRSIRDIAKRAGVDKGE